MISSGRSSRERAGKGQEAIKLRVDEKNDALYLRLDDSKIVESEEVQPGIILDNNDENQVVGIEILGTRTRAPSAKPRTLQFKSA